MKILNYSGKEIDIDIWDQYKIWSHYVSIHCKCKYDFIIRGAASTYLIKHKSSYGSGASYYTEHGMNSQDIGSKSEWLYDKTISSDVGINYLWRNTHLPFIAFLDFFNTITGKEWYAKFEDQIKL